jgi:hypothetical protein
VIWASNTDYNPNGYLKVEDGQLTMYQWSDGTPIDPPWSVPPPKVGNPAKG